MKLGAPVFDTQPNAKSYVDKLKQKNYRAAYCPDYLVSSTQEREVNELKEELAKNDIILAEVGVWRNPLSPNPAEAEEARAYLIDRLRLADMLGARCCVNIIGSDSADFWYAPCAGNFSQGFRDRAVALYRNVLDVVQPKQTFLAFEVMPFCFLDCTDEYLRFLEQMASDRVAVHLDLVNLINNPRTLYDHRAIFSDAVRRLGSRCVSAHIKDIGIEIYPTNTRLNEVPMGEGSIDLEHMAACLDSISVDLPIMLEHLPDEAAYDRATRVFTQAARQAHVHLEGGFV